MENGVQPTTDFDMAAMIHDVEYLGLDQRTADNNMYSNLIRQSFLNFPIANYTKVAFAAKNVIGYSVDRNEDLYRYARNIVETKYNLGNMRFANP